MNTSEGLADLVAAEDVPLFVNAAITATGQREFRPGVPGGMDQRLSLDFLHTFVRVNYRRVQAASPALDINDHNAARIVLGFLESAGEAGAEERRVEGRLIAARLAVLPPPRVYRLFGAVRRAGINNRRTRAIMRDRLAARPDLGHDAVKYRGGVRTAARHIHLRCPPEAEPPAEVGAFLFRPGRPVRCCGCGGCGWTRSGGRPSCTSTPYTTPGDSTYGGWRPGFRRPGSGTRRIHPGQCGVMVYVSDALAAAFVVPHPEDYRLPHASLVEDLFEELVHQYGLLRGPGGGVRGADPGRGAHPYARRSPGGGARAGTGVGGGARQAVRAEAAEHLVRVRAGVPDGVVHPVALPPPVRPGRDGSGQHIGETVTGHKGQVACLKTFRLSDAQVRRGHLLHTLAGAEWKLPRAAGVLGTSREELVRRVRTAGFSRLLKGNAQTGAQSGERAESNVGREPTRWPF
ncbi:hypothetical protein [Streptomyces sp. 196(2019)]|uniref:ARPP-2 domain-containing protein n=1 Tax=Streptomyces sp. 196(2019) TaxID=2683820 RepID=UPI001F0D1982|nr:hypothetical protein [Streptomyces sp. 196(2019)]